MDRADQLVVQIVMMILVSSLFFAINNVQWFELVFLFSKISLVVCAMYIILFFCGFVALFQEIRSTNQGVSVSLSRSNVEILQTVSLAIFLVGFVFGETFYMIWEFSCWQDFIKYNCRLDQIASLDAYIIIRILYLGGNFFYIEWSGQKIKERSKFAVNYRLLHVAICVCILINMFWYENRDVLLRDIKNNLSDNKLCIRDNMTVESNNSCLHGNGSLAYTSVFISIFSSPMGTEYLFLAVTIMIGHWMKVRKLQETEVMTDENNSNDSQVPRASRHSQVPRASPQFELAHISQSHPSDMRPVVTDSSSENRSRWRLFLFFVLFLCIVSQAISVAYLMDDERKLKITKMLFTAGVYFIGVVFFTDLLLIFRRAHRQHYCDDRAHLDPKSLSIFLSSAGVYLRLIAFMLVPVTSFLSSETSSISCVWECLAIVAPHAVEMFLTALGTAIIFFICQDLKDRLYPRTERIKAYLWFFCIGYVFFFMYRSTIEMHENKNSAEFTDFFGREEWLLFYGTVSPLVLYHHFHQAYIVLEYLIAK